MIDSKQHGRLFTEEDVRRLFELRDNAKVSDPDCEECASVEWCIHKASTEGWLEPTVVID